MSTDILGISAFYHDSAACLIRDGHIVAAAQEERFTRKKFDARFPTNAIRYCLQEGGVSLSDLKYFVFYDKPLVKFERLLETYVAFSPKGVKSFLAAMPVWLKDKKVRDVVCWSRAFLFHETLLLHQPPPVGLSRSTWTPLIHSPIRWSLPHGLITGLRLCRAANSASLV